MGNFISFEGGDGVGKSTQILRLSERLTGLGHKVLTVREPGSTPAAERIRALILRGEPGDWLPMSELLLMNAARHDLVERVIRPALALGHWVLADRFADSSRAYQIAAGKLDQGLAEPVIQAATGGLHPHLTLLLEFPIQQAFQRIDEQGGQERRFEAKGQDFQKRALEAFADLAARFPERVSPVSAHGSLEQVEARVWQAVQRKFASEFPQ